MRNALPGVPPIKGVKGLTTNRIATPRLTMGRKGQAPINPFGGNRMIHKRGGAPLSEFLLARSLGSRDPMFIALSSMRSSFEGQAKEAGVPVAVNAAKEGTKKKFWTWPKKVLTGAAIVGTGVIAKKGIDYANRQNAAGGSMNAGVR